MKNPNDFIDRLWLLRMHRWAQRGLKFVAKDQIEEAVDQELVAEAVEALQTDVNLTQPAEIRKKGGGDGGLKSYPLDVDAPS